MSARSPRSAQSPLWQQPQASRRRRHPLGDRRAGLVAGSPTAIPATARSTRRSRSPAARAPTGQSTDVMLVLDLSGSTGTPPSKLANLKSAATTRSPRSTRPTAPPNQYDRGQRVGHRHLPGLDGDVRAPLDSSYADAADRDQHPARSRWRQPAQRRHQHGEQRAHCRAHAANAKAIVLITDGQASGCVLTNTTQRRDCRQGDRRSHRAAVGIGSDVSPGRTWRPGPRTRAYYQPATPGPISKTKLVSDLGAAASMPTTFTRQRGARGDVRPQSR